MKDSPSTPMSDERLQVLKLYGDKEAVWNYKEIQECVAEIEWLRIELAGYKETVTHCRLSEVFICFTARSAEDVRIFYETSATSSKDNHFAEEAE